MKKSLIERFQKLVGIKPLYELDDQMDYKVGDKVKFNPPLMKDRGFENDLEYYDDLIGVVTKVSQDELEIKLSKSIIPPGGGNIDILSLLKAEGDYEMIEKVEPGAFWDVHDSNKISLKDLTFDQIVNTFTDNYQDVHFTRKQPNGEEGNYYRDGINFPNFDDSSTHIGDENAWEDWKSKTMRHYGNVTIVLKPDGKNWFDKVFVDDEAFNTERDKIMRGKASAMQRDQELGRSID